MSSTPGEKAFLKQVFGQDTPLNSVVWRENVSNLAPDGALDVDLVLTTEGSLLKLKDTRSVAFVYYPSGLIAKGVQSYEAGTSRNFPKVILKAGEELWLAASADFFDAYQELSANVTVERVGAGAGVADSKKEKDPLAAGAEALGSSLGFGLALVVFFLLLSRKA